MDFIHGVHPVSRRRLWRRSQSAPRIRGGLAPPYPGLGETTTGDTVPLYHAGSVLGQLIDTIVQPDPGTDKDLAAVLTKVKGKWNWAVETGPAPATASVEGS